MADFQRAYSDLVLAVWDDPSLQDKITADPSLLSSYGFTSIPPKVSFSAAQPTSGGVPGYAKQAETYAAGGDVTFYVPPKPAAQTPGALDDTTVCCCCCPCCTCT